MASIEELEKRYNAHSVTPEAVEGLEQVRKMCRSLSGALVQIVPESRELSVALTKLEEVMFWANAGIARNQT